MTQNPTWLNVVREALAEAKAAGIAGDTEIALDDPEREKKRDLRRRARLAQLASESRSDAARVRAELGAALRELAEARRELVRRASSERRLRFERDRAMIGWRSAYELADDLWYDWEGTEEQWERLKQRLDEALPTDPRPEPERKEESDADTDGSDGATAGDGADACGADHSG